MRMRDYFLILSLLSVSSAAQAKDVSAQQAGVEYARHQVERADAQYKSDLRDLADNEKLLDQRKKAFEQQTKQVADDRKRVELSKRHLEEAKAKQIRAQEILDQAWKE